MTLYRSGAAFAACALTLCAALLPATAQSNRGFTKIFDGKTLSGWTLVGGHGPGYVPRDGILVCPADGGGKLLTEKEYADFVFRFEFKLDKGGNNGVGLRAPIEGDSAYNGMESQILDDYDPMYANLEPGQYCSSIYKVAAAKRGAVKPAGQWNKEEITAVGRHIKIVLNGQTVVDTDLNDVTDPKVIAEHPGFRRQTGHIGFLGHGPSEVQFREIWLKDLTKPEVDNRAPAGFKALFDGKDLTNWKGLLAGPAESPAVRAKMSAAEIAAAQEKADQQMRDHWKVENGALVYDGKGSSLATAKDYGDFELFVDWKIEKGGDSGIYLRGAPQVQIWDPVNHPGQPGAGSGGLYNNQKNPAVPLKTADKPVGEWNRFQILMQGDKVTVFLNGETVVLNTTLENYWERDKPIYPSGQIELQHHGSRLEFKNIYIRELPRK
jgi:hypothetical protein